MAGEKGLMKVPMLLPINSSRKRNLNQLQKRDTSDDEVRDLQLQPTKPSSDDTISYDHEHSGP